MSQLSFNGKSVAVVYQGCYPDPAGRTAGLRRARDFAQGIAESNVVTWLLSPAHFEYGAACADDRFETVHLGMNQPRPTAKSRLAFWRGIRSFSDEKNISAILFYNTTLDCYTTLRHLRQSGKLVALEVCDLFSTMNWKPWKKAIYKLAEIYLPRQTNLNIAISSGIQGWLQKTAPKTPSMIIPGLFDSRDFLKDNIAGNAMRDKYRVSADQCLFVYAGSWYRIKGIETLMRAFASLKASHSNCRLLVTGKPSNHRFDVDIPALVSELGLQDSVILTGFLDNQGMAAVLSGADVVVCPHDKHRFADFAFPTKIAEYAGMGCAIITTDVGDVNRYLKNGVDAIVCPPQNVDAMATCMKMLCSSPELRKSLGMNSKITAERYFDYRKNGVILSEALCSNQSRVGV